jgi:phosphatidylinositol kinase/protein kinase (PI-3  family)
MSWVELILLILISSENYFGSKLYFLLNFFRGFIAVINHYEKILILVEMMYCGHGNKLPCFEKGKLNKNNILIYIGQTAIEELRSRFIPKLNMKTRDYMRHVDTLIEQSIDNWRTKWYDKYQYFVQGIFY